MSVGKTSTVSVTEIIEAALVTHKTELSRFVMSRASGFDVDDLMQIAALRALESSAAIKDPQAIRAWLFTIHRNTVVDAIRKRQREQKLTRAFSNDTTACAPAPTPSSCDCSLKQVGTLPESYSELLTLVDVEDNTLTQAAEKLAITENNARVRLHRARRALRQAMFEHCGVSSLRECLDCRCNTDGCCA